MTSSWHEQRILTALSTVSQGILQMRLGSMADRDLAIALEALVTQDREAVLRAMPSAKAARVLQERDYLTRLKVSPDHRLEMADRLADALEGKGGGESRGATWIAPGRSSRR